MVLKLLVILDNKKQGYVLFQHAAALEKNQEINRLQQETESSLSTLS